MPSSIRPPLMVSIVEIILAVRAGFRNAVQITIGAAAVDTVSVRTNPSTVSQNGGTVDVIATVLATGGRTVPGVTVTFSADHGTLSTTTAFTR